MIERGIDIDTQCPLCDAEVETPIHALRDCQFASEVLQLAPIASLPQAIQHTNIHDWLLDLAEQLPKTSLNFIHAALVYLAQ